MDHRSVAEGLELYGERLKDILRHENELTNHRLTWLLTTQAILFAASAQFMESWFFPTILVCLVGISTTLSFSHALKRSFESREWLRGLWREKIKNQPSNSQQLPPLDGDRPDGRNKDWLLPWRFVPIVLTLAWLLLLGYVLWGYGPCALQPRP